MSQAGGAARGLRIEQVDPLRHADAISGLFAAEGEPGFGAYFARVYPAEVEAGARSWVAFAPDGRMVLHVVRFVYEFCEAGRTVVGGLTANLMVARDYRTLQPAVALMRRMAEDDRATGQIDFLFTTTHRGTVPVLRLAGYDIPGQVARYVMPLADRNPLVDLGLRARNRLQRLRMGGDRAHWSARDTVDVSQRDPIPAGLTGMVSHGVSRSLRRRLAGFPSAADITWDEGQGRWVLVREDVAKCRGEIVALSPSAAAHFTHTALGLVPHLRARLRRLWLHAVVGSPLARAAVRAGFVERPDQAPLMGVALTPRGTEALAALPHGMLCGVDFDGSAE